MKYENARKARKTAKIVLFSIAAVQHLKWAMEAMDE